MKLDSKGEKKRQQQNHLQEIAEDKEYVIRGAVELCLKQHLPAP